MSVFCRGGRGDGTDVGESAGESEGGGGLRALDW